MGVRHAAPGPVLSTAMEPGILASTRRALRLVQFAPLEGYARVDAYFGLLDELRAILGRDVDLVVSGAVKNPYIVQKIESTRQILYAA